MSKDKESSSDGCLIWIIIIFVIMGQCDRIDRLEKRLDKIEQSK